MKVCDNKSVGILTWGVSGLLLIQRRRPPPGWAPPAGHVDDHGSSAEAAVRELLEETGLEARSLELIASGRKNNKCRRPGGSWHYWEIFVARSTGALHPSRQETLGAKYFSKLAVAELLSPSSDALEAVWREWFIDIDLIGRFDEFSAKAGFP